jgi:glucose/arabinose dehydrogenase
MRTTRGILRAALVLGAWAGACRATPVPADPESATSGPRDSIAVAGHTLRVPVGFHVQTFADRLSGVRYLAVGPGGAVYAALSDNGRIVLLKDVDGDGVADSVTTVLAGLDYPFGIAFRGDTMYFAEQTTVKRLDPGSSTPVALVATQASGGHSTRTIVFGPDNRLYLAIGSSCNICSGDVAPRAAVTRYERDGSGAHTFATGLRNSVGLAFNPATGELWATNNERDDIGPTGRDTDSLPPEELNVLTDGSWHGWPRCWRPGRANPEYAGADCSSVAPAAITFTAHSAPLGLVFYQGTMFPADYRGDAFVAFHGSWDRSVPTGAKVVRVHLQGGHAVSSEDFVTGWQLPSGSRWGRPVSLAVLADGSLLVSDDQGSRIWRVTYGR